MVFYKVLNANGRSCHGGSMQWSLPTKNEDGSWTPGEWAPTIEGPLVECKNGYHLATLEQLPLWLDERIFVAEVDGEVVKAESGDKWISRKVRLVRETAWDQRAALLFAADCAEHVLHLYEREYQNDSRPRMAIETARKYTNGKATREELAAARAAAWAAARAADLADDWVADWVDDRAAARAAASAAARAAAEAADWVDARAAARAAAWAAAWAAARAAAWAAAWAAELEWQSNRLAEYLEVR